MLNGVIISILSPPSPCTVPFLVAALAVSIYHVWNPPSRVVWEIYFFQRVNSNCKVPHHDLVYVYGATLVKELVESLSSTDK